MVLPPSADLKIVISYFSLHSLENTISIQKRYFICWHPPKYTKRISNSESFDELLPLKYFEITGRLKYGPPPSCGGKKQRISH